VLLDGAKAVREARSADRNAGLQAGGEAMKRLALSLLAVLALTAQTYTGVSVGPTISLMVNTSRTSGSAPLAVSFSMEQTTNAFGYDSFGELVYDVSFGDTDGGSTWATDGLSKNAMRGPVVAHLFKNVGTFNVVVTVTAPNGSTAQKTVPITVDDPDTTFSGTNTVCVSTSGTFTGCPAGATQTTSSDFDATCQTGAGKRTLYRRGETFDSSVKKTFASAVGRIGVFGAGTARAIVTVSHASANVMEFNAATPASDWAVSDIEWQSLDPGQSVFGKVNAGILANLTMSNNKHVGGGLANIGNQHHTGLALFENDTSLCDGGLGNTCVFIQSDPLMAVGNSMVDSSAAEHVFRDSWSRRTTIASNIFSTPANSKHALKFHADSGAGNESEYFNLYHNFLKGKTGAAVTVDIGPQNSSSDERVRWGVIDSNYFENIDSSVGALRLATEGNIWIRNNVFELGSNSPGVSISKNGGMPTVPLANHFFANNTCRSAVAVGPVCVQSGGSAQREAYNTIILSNDAGADAVAGTVDVEAGSQVKTLSSNPFVTNPPTTWAQYEFAIGGSADVNGVATDGIRYDYKGTARPNPPNVGHHEP
jgi:hypothetical protein